MHSNSNFNQITDYVTPEFYGSLMILFINADTFARFFDERGAKRMVVIEGIDKLTKEETETIVIRYKKWNEKTDELRNKISQDRKELEKWLNLLLDNITHPHKIPASLLSKEIIEGVTADLISQCITEYRAQSHIFDKPSVIRQLTKKLKLLEPWSQTSICENCEIFELLLSSFPLKSTKCSKCNQTMKTIRIYKLDSDYEKLKTINYDLPEFIRLYLGKKIKNKVETQVPLNTTTGGDIDVLVHDGKIGIECKLFVNPTVEGNSLKSRIGELIDILTKYLRSGKVERLVVVTNLDKKYREEIRTKIRSSLAKTIYPHSNLEVVCNSIEDLVEVLGKEIAYVESLNVSKI